MATIKIEIKAGGDTHTVTKTISGAHLTRFMNAQKVLLNLEDNVTNSQVASAWFSSVFKAMKGQVVSHERAAAQKAASDGVADIGLT